MEDKETGKRIEDNDDVKIQKRQMEQLRGGILGIPTVCQHCYCGKITINDQPHLVCCMCGHRTLVNPIKY